MKYPELNRVLMNEGQSQVAINIVELVATGLSNKEIANQLFLDERSVKNILMSVYDSMQFRSRTQLIVWCLPLMETR